MFISVKAFGTKFLATVAVLYNVLIAWILFLAKSPIPPPPAPVPTSLLFSLLLSSSAESYLAEEEKNLKSKGPTSAFRQQQ